MKETTLSQFLLMALAALCVTLAVPPATASAEDNPWHLRLSMISMDPSGTSVTVSDTGESISYSNTNGTGFGIDLEYRASKRLGIDFGVFSASPSIDVEVGYQPFTISASGDLKITPICAALNVHLTPNSRFDLYIGPLLAYVRYGGFKLAAAPGLVETFTTEHDFGVGGVVGLDIGLGSGQWSLNAAVRYIDTTLEAASSDGGPGRTDIDPTIYSLGVGVRF
jgi:outer membrane protein W